MMSNEPRAGLARHILINAATLAGFAVLAAALVALTLDLTRERIETNEALHLLSQLRQVVPPDLIDNNLHEDTLVMQDDPLLGQPEPFTVYRGRRDGEPVVVILPVVAPDGYNGPIHLLVGILADGTIAGVHVLRHNETPGLGDGIESRKSDWHQQFRGRALGDPPRKGWDTRRDGGEFDALTGASITPRAVIRAIHNALLYFEHNREQLLGESTPDPAEAP